MCAVSAASRYAPKLVGLLMDSTIEEYTVTLTELKATLSAAEQAVRQSRTGSVCCVDVAIFVDDCRV